MEITIARKITEILIGFLLICMTAAHAQKSDIYSPYSVDNAEKLEWDGGYCKSINEEKKLWTEINKYAYSLLKIFPQIPPEQKAYIKAERNSGNTNRMIGIMNSSFYKMNDLYENTDNIEKLSSLYISSINYLSMGKKMEFIGRTLANLNEEKIPYEQVEMVSADLKSKNYLVNSNDLRTNWALNNAVRRSLISHLICYGEK